MNLKLAVGKSRPFDTPAERATDETTSHATRLPKDASKVAGYQGERIPTAPFVLSALRSKVYRGMNGVPRDAQRIARDISLLAVRSLHRELVLYPKPGLVSLRDNGAHDDMDAATFVRSLFSLRGYFAAIAAAGMVDAGFAELQRLGLTAEERMLRATRGINTHRGAIFTHGILAAAAGCAAVRDIAPSDENLRKIVMENWSRELRAVAVAAAATPSHGQLVAARHGVAGARGEALLGFPSVFEVALPALRSALARGADTDAALLHTFFVLLAGTEDTNVLYRGGAGALQFIQMQAGEFIERGSVFEPGWQQRAEALHRRCSAKNLSPGGCADLLAAAWFVHQLQGTRQ